jgi:hypothetical protein
MPLTDVEIIQAWAKEAGLKPDYLPIDELLQYVENTRPVNPKKHRHKDLSATKGSIHTSGFKVPPLLWTNPKTGKVELVFGSGRIQSAADDGLPGLPVNWDLNMTPAQAKALRLADNRTPELSSAYDDQIIIDTLKDLKLAEMDMAYLGYEKYDKFLVADQAASDPIFEDIAPGYEERVNGPRKVDSEVGPARPLPLGSEEPDLHPPLPPISQESPYAGTSDVPLWRGRLALHYPSDNEYGIPTLSMKYMATTVDFPVDKWGEIGRNAKRSGLWHFYVDDPKFEGLIKNPNGPLFGAATACVEPNFSLHPQDDLAIVLYYTYMKRLLARYWQSKGMKIFVDLWVPGKFAEINMLGVPDGWKSYAIRGNSGQLKYIEVMYLDAVEKAGGEDAEDDVIYLVYGGGQDTQKACEEYGWTWIPERMQVVSNPLLAGMDGRDNVVPYDDFKDIKK